MTRCEPRARVSAPTLETERLRLRAHLPSDLAPYHAMWSDPEVVRYISGRPATREEAWGRLLRGLGHWQVMGFGYWVVVDKATGRFAGEVGLADFRREITPSLEGAPEAGWVIAPWAHGRGLATEAVRAVLAWADEALGTPRTVCIISPENTASLRVAGKCGFREQCLSTYRDAPTLIMER